MRPPNKMPVLLAFRPPNKMPVLWIALIVRNNEHHGLCISAIHLIAVDRTKLLKEFACTFVVHDVRVERTLLPEIDGTRISPQHLDRGGSVSPGGADELGFEATVEQRAVLTTAAEWRNDLHFDVEVYHVAEASESIVCATDDRVGRVLARSTAKTYLDAARPFEFSDIEPRELVRGEN